MDSGLSGSATCVVSVIDPKGLAATGNHFRELCLPVTLNPL